MTKNQFISLQEEDIETSTNPMLKPILEGFKEYIPSNADISEDKSTLGMYNYMYEYAKKNQKDGVCCVNPFEGFKSLMYGYLEIKESKPISIDVVVSLEDIFS